MSRIGVEHGAELFEWPGRGGLVFVCGDAERMAVDVDRALHKVVAQHGGMDEGSARAFVSRLNAEGRYRRDVY